MSVRLRLGRRATAEAIGVANWASERYGVSIGRDLVTGPSASVVIDGRGVHCVDSAGSDLLFHPGIAVVRLKRLAAGQRDVMGEAMGLRPGVRVLDCTLGLAADAIVASALVGADGLVTGIESSLAVALTVAAGLRLYKKDHGLTGACALTTAMRRVEVVCGDHEEFLARQSAGSYDVVYFDPMFRKPVDRKGSIAGLRMYANHEPLAPEVIKLARKVARYRVVLKERAGSPEFERLGFSEIVPTSGRIAYGWAPGCERP